MKPNVNLSVAILNLPTSPLFLIRVCFTLTFFPQVLFEAMRMGFTDRRDGDFKFR